MTTPYITVSDAEEYFSGRLNSNAWDNATESDKLKSLIHATRLINNLKFIGQLALSNQSNAFPRLGQALVPTAIGEATCELALQLLDDVDPNEEIKEMSMSSGQLGSVKNSNDTGCVLSHVRNGIPSSEAWAKLLPYLIDPLAIKLVRM